MSDFDRRRHPLQGVRVLDLGQIYNGPYAGFLLAMAGADVVKVEPLGGEAIRARGGAREAPFAMGILNSNKRGLAIDLKQAEGQALLIELVREADVLLENFAPGAMERLNLGATRLQEINPRLIYASSTGYGRSGPDKDRLAMDLTIQAYSGVMSVNGPGDGPPLKTGPAICDFLGGVHLYAGITTALYEREQTGFGRVVEIAMLEATYPVLATNLTSMHNRGGEQPPRLGNSHPAGASAPYGVYPTSDGHAAIICVREVHWERLRTIMGREDLKDDPLFKDQPTRGANSERVDEAVSAWTRERTRHEVASVLRDAGVPVAPVRTLPEVSEDPHMHERGMLHRLHHPNFGDVVLPHSPLRFEGEERVPLQPLPRLGEHTETVLGEWLAYDAERIRSLVDNEIVRTG